ncbi:MAG: hypothetical protein FH756_08385 [Firmicutes bacterium]|nr:hypothetical protein [Bacillota bacterium]
MKMARRKGLKTSGSSTRPKNEVREIDFTEAVDIFLTGMLLKGLAPRTREWHKENLSALKNFLTQEEKNTAPVSMTENILKQNFNLPMIKHGFKINTINGRIRTCRSFYTYLLKEGYISSNPAKRLTKLKQDKPIIETFTKNQVNKLLSVINRQTFVGFRDYVIILLFLETGIRVSEAVRIKVEHILFEEQMIRIHGKGAKGRIVPFQTKLKGLLLRAVFIMLLFNFAAPEIYVNLHCVHILMAKYFLQRKGISPAQNIVFSKGMAHGVGRDAYVNDFSLFAILFKLVLNGAAAKGCPMDTSE